MKKNFMRNDAGIEGRAMEEEGNAAQKEGFFWKREL